MSELILSQMSTAPSAPSTGKVSVYVDGNGDLSWKDAAGNITKIAAAGSYTLTLNSSGTLALGGFTLTVPATGTAALYATNTWTPVLKFGTTTVTGVTITSANYATVGPMCFAQCDITLTGKNGTGAVTIAGLPVAAAAAGHWAASVGYYAALGSNVSFLTGFVAPSTSVISVFKAVVGTDAGSALDSDFSTTTRLIVSVAYRTA